MPAPRTIRAEAPLSDFSIAPSGSVMAAALRDGRIRVWSSKGDLLHAWAASDPPTPFLMYAGDRRLCAGGPGGMTILDAESGGRIAGWPVPELVHAAAAADASVLAGAGADGTVRLWKPDGTTIRGLSAPGLLEIARVAVSPNGSRVAACGTDADVRVFDVRTGALERVLDLTMAAFALAFSRDGHTLATGCGDGQVKLWDVASGRLHATLGRYPIGVGAIAFSPDGRRLVSASISQNPASAEAEARLCDLASGREASTPLGVSRWNALGFAPDGRAYVALLRAETISLLDLST